MVITTSGCVVLPNKEIRYKDADVEVARHESFAVLADAGSISFKLIALKHTYILADWIDCWCDDCKGFVRTPDDSAIVFIAKSQQKPQEGVLAGTVHVIDLKSKSDVEVPLAIKCRGDGFHLLIKSYDGKKLTLFMDSNRTASAGSNYNAHFSITLEIDLDAKRVSSFKRIQ